MDYQKMYRVEMEELVRAANYIDQKGFVTSQGGNLSYRVDEDVILITPTKVAKRSITFNDVVAIDFEGNILFAKNNRKPTGEAPFHIHILKKRPDLNALVHAHPPKITGFAIAHNNLLSRPLLPEPIIEVGPVLSTMYAEPLSQELADAFDKVVLLSNAFLMENHGFLIGSYESMERAVELLEMMEATADSISTALMVGEIHEISKEELLRLENVMKIRNLPLPGLPGVNHSLLDIYNFI